MPFPEAMRSKFTIVVVILLLVAALVYGDTKRKNSKVSNTPPPAFASTITTISVVPANINFNATDPDFPSVSGSSAATGTFSMTGGAPSRNWTFSVQAGASNFTGCTTVPASAVTVTCSSATNSNSGGSAGTAVCSAPFSLSTTAQQVAGGREGSSSDSYTITINYTLTDSWKFIAATAPTCPITLTYTADAP